MKTIPLTQGKFALVDDDDYDRLVLHKWYAYKHGHTWYAGRAVRIANTQKYKNIHMHQEVMWFHCGPANGRDVDHRNRNGLDNQKHNIWYCTHRKNMENSRNNTSGYPGVMFNRDRQKWWSRAYINGKTVHIGYFLTAKEAYEARVEYLKSKGV